MTVSATSSSPTEIDRVPIDDVLAVLDEPPPTYRELYYRWEAQRWEAAALDLSEDRRQWAERPRPRGLVERLNHVRTVVEALRPAATTLADSMAVEDQQVFLTTQIADEARRAVLLDRFFAEVVGGAEPEVLSGPTDLLRILEEACSDALALRRDRRARGVAVLVCHLVVEDGSLLSSLRAAVRALDERAALPGLRAGLTHAARDSTRHIAFALRFLREWTSRSERNGALARAALEEAVPRLRGSTVGDVDDDAGALAPDRVTRYAVESLSARLAAVGLDMPDPLDQG